MPDYSELTNKELAKLVKERFGRIFTVYELNAELLQEVIRRLEKPDGLLKSLDEALNMGDGTYRP